MPVHIEQRVRRSVAESASNSASVQSLLVEFSNERTDMARNLSDIN